MFIHSQMAVLSIDVCVSSSLVKSTERCVVYHQSEGRMVIYVRGVVLPAPWLSFAPFRGGMNVIHQSVLLDAKRREVLLTHF